MLMTKPKKLLQAIPTLRQIADLCDAVMAMGAGIQAHK